MFFIRVTERAAIKFLPSCARVIRQALKAKGAGGDCCRRQVAALAINSSRGRPFLGAVACSCAQLRLRESIVLRRPGQIKRLVRRGRPTLSPSCYERHSKGPLFLSSSKFTLSARRKFDSESANRFGLADARASSSRQIKFRTRQLRAPEDDIIKWSEQTERTLSEEPQSKGQTCFHPRPARAYRRVSPDPH